MMIPYIVPQLVPIGIGSSIYGGIGSPILGGLGNQGLIHSGPGIGGMMQPIYRSPGMIPYGYGYGLMHSGPELQGIGPIGYGSIGYGPGIGPIGYSPIGYGPTGYHPIQPPMGMPGGITGNGPIYSTPPLQPAWSGGLGTNI